MLGVVRRYETSLSDIIWAASSDFIGATKDVNVLKMTSSSREMAQLRQLDVVEGRCNVVYKELKYTPRINQE